MRPAVRPLRSTDQAAFIAAVCRSRDLHKPWVSPPRDAAAFAVYLNRCTSPANHGFVVHDTATGELLGAVNLTNIVLGALRSGYLGYFAFAGHQGQGHMKAGLHWVIRHAFKTLGLHRIEANVQPGNAASIALVQSCGFSREGYSPAYLKIGGRWRDHERWALVRPSRHPT